MSDFNANGTPSEAQNSESFVSEEINDFHSSLSARELSSSDSSTNESEQAAQSSSSHLGASLSISGGIGATAIVTTVVLVASPSISTLPKVESLTTDVSASSVTYSFNCTYVKASSLQVRLTSPFASEDKAYELAVDSSSSEAVSSVSLASSSVSPSSSTSQEKIIQGTFAGLLPSTAYVISVMTPLSGNTLTTLKSASFTTEANPSAQVSFASTSLDYTAKDLLYTLSIADSSSVLDQTSLYLEVNGKSPSLTSLTKKGNLSAPINGEQHFSLADFVQGNYLRLTLWGSLKASSGDSIAGVSPQKLAQMALYY